VRAWCAILCVGLLVAAANLAAQAAAAPPFTDADAERFSQKIAGLVRNGASPAASRPPVAITVTEPEVNAYLHYRAKPQLPVGVIDPAVSALGGGRISASATVDLDAVRLSKPRSWFDPMRLLRGRLPVDVRGVLRTSAGEARLEIEWARVNGVSIPTVVLQELVTFYTKGESYPNGIDLDAPFALPLGIRDITVLAGRATITQ